MTDWISQISHVCYVLPAHDPRTGICYDAFQKHMAGLAGVLFPFGTFWMRKFGKVACETAEAVEQALLGPPMNPSPA